MIGQEVTALADGVRVTVDTGDILAGFAQITIPWEHANRVAGKIIGETMKHGIHEATKPHAEQVDPDLKPAEPMIEVTRDFLVRVDSYTSLVAHRHARGPIPADVVDELKRLSAEARALYGAANEDRRAKP